jgi:hypothetical protein
VARTKNPRRERTCCSGDTVLSPVGSLLTCSDVGRFVVTDCSVRIGLITPEWFGENTKKSAGAFAVAEQSPVRASSFPRKLRHSRASGNPLEVTLYGVIPATAGISWPPGTDQRAIRADTRYVPAGMRINPSPANTNNRVVTESDSGPMAFYGADEYGSPRNDGFVSLPILCAIEFGFGSVGAR